MEKIISLTEAQKARFPEFVKKWTDIGLSTTQTNKKEAEEGILEAYALASKAAPKIVWCSSPMAQALTRAIVMNMGVKDPKERDAAIEKNARDSVSQSGYGQHDANWLAFYDFFDEVCGLKDETAKLSGLMKIARNAGWFIPHEKICWVSERPVELHKDDQGRLHCETGMALKYSDGWGVYAWHGVRFAFEMGFVIDKPELITVEHIEKEENSELRRVMTERYGLVRYLKDSKAEIVHEDKDQFGRPRVLYRKDQGQDEALLMVHVKNSTAEPDGEFKDYFLRVPPTIRRAGEAVAWTWNLSEAEYSCAQET